MMRRIRFRYLNLYAVIEDRKANPKEGSYTNYLFDKGIDKILKKAERKPQRSLLQQRIQSEEVKYEMADFLYHAMVLMVEKDSTGMILWVSLPTDKIRGI